MALAQRPRSQLVRRATTRHVRSSNRGLWTPAQERRPRNRLHTTCRDVPQSTVPMDDAQVKVLTQFIESLIELAGIPAPCAGDLARRCIPKLPDESIETVRALYELPKMSDFFEAYHFLAWADLENRCQYLYQADGKSQENFRRMEASFRKMWKTIASVAPEQPSIARKLFVFASERVEDIDDFLEAVEEELGFQTWLSTVVTRPILNVAWRLLIGPHLDYIVFEALKKDGALESDTFDLEAAINIDQRGIRKSDAPNAFLEVCLLKAPSTIVMGAMSLRTQLGLFYAMATSSLAAMVLAYGSYVTLASSAKQTQRAKAARDEAT
ncbi:predicted protein [Verticillium alfalfae VaMs.102]|uniref:Transmembrane protein n=2 Tax=Verticillium TaxID=1036719 RepID=G2X530_VERDV|nr:predicted protein [Verticillium alfalfae VaMs.102]XP_009653293.1 uncharacterized protein VDAG_05262 [Verticillium dahliae VdLs.17]EEY24046.1 predicted protein [Verticillium alfalfae VaMs.102]EGY23824.1 hypothetical protein VDAG_05262 [Verticillium dahliae VdLs.17]KAH6699466.1 hypothetical protein EV126DRAFT_443161 [Verticillium dahliae]